ncbi:serine/threonine-protein kinase [Nonomuraea sp. NPDC000554]|uniref:serine/threonine-protein kinase n=1 Tax=Nonomuraea sp. NPDC000554 TaxID=3154259 RepID=UPI00332D6141
MEALLDGDPQRLGGYWLAGRLGAGGQGVVYEAYAEDGRRVAIKVLHGDQAAQLSREVTAARRVAAFCTAAVVEAVLDGPRPYIVSEYVEGPSLRTAVSRGRRFDGGNLHRLATAIATALTAIHDAGVIHRDLKPDNVLLGPDGPRVIDFGIARTAEMSLTATGLVTGTPTYMAPEVFTGQRAGMPADVFAWGGIMLFAATGADPFEAESLGGVMHRVLSATPDLEVLPGSLRPLVASALSKDPAERPTARQLLLALVSGDGGLDTAHLLARGGREAAQVATQADDPALGTLAEEAYALLSSDEREHAPDVFLRLVTVTEQGRLEVRRAALAELVEGRPLPEVASITRIMEVFGYLLARDGEEVWLARPALPHAWPRLRRWIDANRDGLAAHREITSAASRWDRAGRRDGDLFQGTSLENALQWAATARKNITLSPAERDFLEAGAHLTRRRSRRNRLVSVSLAGLLVISLVAGGLAVQQSMVADERTGQVARQRDQAEAARLAQFAGTLRQSDPRAAMQLSVAAWRMDRTPRTRAALTASLAQREIATFRDPTGSGDTLRTLSADGRTLVSASDDAVRLWDVRNGRRTGGIARLGMAGEPLRGLALSPTGRTVLVVTAKQAQVRDLSTGATVRTWRFDRKVGDDTGTPVSVMYGTVDRYALLRLDDETYVWDLERGGRVKTSAWIGAMTPSGDAAYAATDGGRIERLRLPGLTPRGSRAPADHCGDCGRPLALTPDGKSLVEPLRSGVQLTDLRNGSSRTLGQDRPTWNRGELTFSGDGRLLASVTRTGIQVWRSGGRLLTTLSLPGGAEDDAQLLPQVGFDGHTLRYLSEDHVVTVDLSDLAMREPKAEPSWMWATLGPGARQVLASEDGQKVYLADPRGPLGSPVLKKPDSEAVDAAAVSPDGRLAAVGGLKGITVVDTGSRRAAAELVPGGELESYETSFLTFSPDGSKLAAGMRAVDDGASDFALGVWDWKSGRLLWSARVGEVRDADFSPDGRVLAVATGEQRLFDVASGKQLGKVFGGTGQGTTISDVLFTRDGRSVAAVDSRGRVTVFDAATRRQVGQPARGRLNGGNVAARSPREDVIAVAAGGRVQLFDLATGADLGLLRDGSQGELYGMAFAADGSSVLTLDSTGVVREELVEPGRMAAAICSRAGRPLSPAEWRDYVTGVPYLKVCP